MASSASMKQRWNDCLIVADFLGTTKQFIHRITADLKKADLWDGLLLQNEESKTKALEFLKPYYSVQPKLFDENKADEGITVPAAGLSCAMWFIKKVGNVDEAERIMKIAIRACREYKK